MSPQPMKKFALLLNGDLTVTDRLRAQIGDAVIVAVDGGMRHAQRLNVSPACWIGDFDSVDEELRDQWRDVPCQSYRADKDKTDGELAIDYCLENGAREIVLVGGLGGQSDHSFCHLLQLIKLARANIGCFVTSGHEEGWPLMAGGMSMDFPLGSKLSIIGLSELKGFSISGVKWPLDNVDIELGSSLTISNEVVGLVSTNLKGGYGVFLVKDVV